MAHQVWPCCLENEAVQVAAEIVLHAWNRMALHGEVVKDSFENAFGDIQVEAEVRHLEPDPAKTE